MALIIVHPFFDTDFSVQQLNAVSKREYVSALQELCAQHSDIALYERDHDIAKTLFLFRRLKIAQPVHIATNPADHNLVIPTQEDEWLQSIATRTLDCAGGYSWHGDFGFGGCLGQTITRLKTKGYRCIVDTRATYIPHLTQSLSSCVR